MKGYPYPVSDEGAYETEPTDEQCVVLLRALWHYASAYEPRGIADTTVGTIVRDLIDSSGGWVGNPGLGLTRDEWVALGSTIGVPV